MPTDIEADLPPIFLVEDNPDDEGLAIRALRKGGVTNPVIVARDGEEAIRRLSDFSSGSLPVIVLLDLKLPKLSGIEVLGQIRANAEMKLVPVIVLTSSDEAVDVLACYTKGANAYVRKPVDFDEFLESIDSIVRFWLKRNLGPPTSR